MTKNANHTRFSGFADLYDQARPVPPEKVCAMLLNFMGRNTLDTVVDLGCGTGLSTQIWTSHARQVIGVEPNPDMRNVARKNCPEALILDGSSTATGLENSCADLVTCSQSFHWMEPEPTLAECGRILKPQGVLAVYDCQWPVFIASEAEAAWHTFINAVNGHWNTHADQLPHVSSWPKSQHLHNIQSSGFFSYCREVFFENTEPCDAQRFIDIAYSQGQFQGLVRAGIPGLEDLKTRFEEAVHKSIPTPRDMLVPYRMQMGEKS